MHYSHLLSIGIIKYSTHVIAASEACINVYLFVFIVNNLLQLCHSLYSDSASPKPGAMRRVML